MLMGLRETSIALAVLALVFSSTIASTLWVKGDVIRKLDKKVVGVKQDRGVPGSESLKKWESKESTLEA